MSSQPSWDCYQRHYCRIAEIGLTLDISRMRFAAGFFDTMAPAMKRAFLAMEALEGGAIANPDENRRVGHYWLRSPERAPSPEIGAEIRATGAAIKAFAGEVHAGKIQPQKAARFTRVSCRLGSAVRHWGRCSWPTRSAIRRPTGCGWRSSTTPIPTASRASCGGSAASWPRR